MNLFKTIYARGFQLIMRLASYFLNFSRPQTINDDDIAKALVDISRKHGFKRWLLITDEGLIKLGMIAPLIDACAKLDIAIAVYDKTIANPTIDNIEEALRVYHDFGAQALIGFGGGSPLDCAKGVYARLARPRRSISSMRGLLKVGRRATILVAIPTTSGTGSEATLAAVISDSKTHEKYAINDPHLIPNYAILSPKLTVGLPKHITSTTGMDALTHAVEAYIGRSNTKYTRQASLKAIKLIHENLLECYHHPDSVQARSNMQVAALEAGVAFTRAYVGHIHCLAHQLGGYYRVPHGLANAVILPIVLRDMFSKIVGPLARLSDHIRLLPSASSDEEKAKAFIAWIDDMNDKMNITNSFGQLIKEEDIPLLSRRAYREGFPLYPVPELWNQTRYMRIFRKLKQEV